MKKQTKMQNVILYLALPTVLSMCIATSQAATIVTFDNVSPNTGSGTILTFGSVSQGTPSSTTAGFPVNSASSVNTGTYNVSLTGLTIDGIMGVDLMFDMTLTASAGDGAKVDGGATKTWVVDGAPAGGGGLETNRIDSGETLSFFIDNITTTAPMGSFDATFNGFTNVDFINGTAGIFAAGNPALVSFGSGTSFRAYQADFSFTLSAAVPEPSTFALAAFGLLALGRSLNRRGRNRRG